MKPLFRYVLLTTAVIVTVLSPSAAEKTGDTKLGEKNAEEALWDFVEEEAAPLPGADQTASAPLSAGGGFTSVKIELPRKWDELMEKANYKPLSSFYLKSDLRPASTPQQFKNYRRRSFNR